MGWDVFCEGCGSTRFLCSWDTWFQMDQDAVRLTAYESPGVGTWEDFIRHTVDESYLTREGLWGLRLFLQPSRTKPGFWTPEAVNHILEWLEMLDVETLFYDHRITERELDRWKRLEKVFRCAQQHHAEVWIQ